MTLGGGTIAPGRPSPSSPAGPPGLRPRPRPVAKRGFVVSSSARAGARACARASRSRFWTSFPVGLDRMGGMSPRMSPAVKVFADNDLPSKRGAGDMVPTILICLLYIFIYLFYILIYLYIIRKPCPPCPPFCRKSLRTMTLTAGDMRGTCGGHAPFTPPCPPGASRAVRAPAASG